MAHSRAAAAVYHSAFSAFCMSTTPNDFEAAMHTLEAAQRTFATADRYSIQSIVQLHLGACIHILHDVLHSAEVRPRLPG